MKSKGVAYLLWFFLGIFGAHKFYLGKAGIGFLYLITFGLFGIGWIIDVFSLGTQVDLYNSLYFGRGNMNRNTNTNTNVNNNNNNIVVNVPSPAQPGLNVSEQLHKLSDLKEKGILSQEEFEAQKAKILG